jgi:adenylate cyclase class 1
VHGAIDFSAGIGRRELESVQRRFQILHRDRLLRVLGELRPAQRDFLQLLPMLFHVNHPLLPGFVGIDTPAGIADFTPSRQQLQLAKSSCRSLPGGRRRSRSLPVQALYIMGSAGSIGHSRASDLDIWLCHQGGLEPQRLEELETKARRVEARAEELGLELHIFPMDVAEFRRGKLPRLSGHSSGSTQHGLLLEEFYRSGLLVAGRFPLWWLVPPDREGDYGEFTRELVRRRFVKPDRFLDFGGLDQIAENEFFGAGIWHLFNGVRTPYKAVLKILLMEAYAQAFPQPEWLALRIKRTLYAGEANVEQLDAYLLMYREVETYLTARNQPQRLELARRCLYFKVGEPLSRLGKTAGWRARIMQELVRDWGWQGSRLRDLDGRAHWKIERVIGERDRLVRELNRSYRLLSEFATGHGLKLRVTPEELHLLGRRLYTAMEQRPGKVERVNPGISEDLSEPELAFAWKQVEGQQVWTLYRAAEGAPIDQPLKVSRSLVELLTWCQVNGLSTEATRFHSISPDSPVQERELRRLANGLREALPASGLDVPLNQLAGPPWPLRGVAVVNIGADPQLLLTREGLRLVSDRSDPLSYGAMRRCLVINLELLVHTSWGELIAHRYEGSEGLLDALCYYLDLCQRAPEATPIPSLQITCVAASAGSSLARRIEQVFTDAARFFRETAEGRYLLGLAEATFTVQTCERGFRWSRQDSHEELLDALSEPRARFSPVGVDVGTLADSPLPTVLRLSRAGELRASYLDHQGHTQVYVTDETGALFHDRIENGDPQFVLTRLERFLHSMDRLRGAVDLHVSGTNSWQRPALFRLERMPDRSWQAQPARLASAPSEYLDLRLVAEKSANNVTVLSLVCGEREISALSLGASLYEEAARLILKHRSGGRYPLYLTEVELIQERYGVPPTGVELLCLKRRVEARLNQALRALPKSLPEV